MFFSCQVVDTCDIIDIWLQDSGSSSHMIGKKSMFSSLDVYVKTNVNLRDDHLVDS